MVRTIFRKLFRNDEFFRIRVETESENFAFVVDQIRRKVASSIASYSERRQCVSVEKVHKISNRLFWGFRVKSNLRSLILLQ